MEMSRLYPKPQKTAFGSRDEEAHDDKSARLKAGIKETKMKNQTWEGQQHQQQ